MSDNYIYGPPNPEGSPLEKVLIPNKSRAFWKLERDLMNAGLEPEVSRNIIEAFKNYEIERQYDELRNYQELEYWSNIHTHEMGGIKLGEFGEGTACRSTGPTFWHRFIGGGQEEDPINMLAEYNTQVETCYPTLSGSTPATEIEGPHGDAAHNPSGAEALGSYQGDATTSEWDGTTLAWFKFYDNATESGVLYSKNPGAGVSTLEIDQFVVWVTPSSFSIAVWVGDVKQGFSIDDLNWHLLVTRLNAEEGTVDVWIDAVHRATIHSAVVPIRRSGGTMHVLRGRKAVPGVFYRPDGVALAEIVGWKEALSDEEILEILDGFKDVLRDQGITHDTQFDHSTSYEGSLSKDEDTGSLQLAGDEEAPQIESYYGTDGDGVKGFHSIVPAEDSFRAIDVSTGYEDRPATATVYWKGGIQPPAKAEIGDFWLNPKKDQYMTLLFMAGFEEQLGDNEWPGGSYDQNFNPIANRGAYESGALSHTPYLGYGSYLSYQGAFGTPRGDSRASRTWNRVPTPGLSSTRIVIGCQLAVQESEIGFMARWVKTGGAVVTVERGPDYHTDMRIHSSGLSGTNFDELFLGIGKDLPLTTSAVLMIDDLGANGVHVQYILDGVVEAEVNHPDGQLPTEAWDYVDVGLMHYQAGGGLRELGCDDLYITTDAPRYGAKVITTRPTTQGFHTDWIADAGTKPGNTANTPPDVSTSISGTSGDQDSVVMDSLATEKLTVRPFVEAVQHTVLGKAASGFTVDAFVRHNSADALASPMNTLETGESLGYRLYEFADHPEGELTDTLVDNSEWGMVVNLE